MNAAIERALPVARNRRSASIAFSSEGSMGDEGENGSKTGNA